MTANQARIFLGLTGLLFGFVLGIGFEFSKIVQLFGYEYSSDSFGIEILIIFSALAFFPTIFALFRHWPTARLLKAALFYLAIIFTACLVSGRGLDGLPEFSRYIPLFIIPTAASWPFLLTHSASKTIFDYTGLHNHAWEILIRCAIATVFGFVFFGVSRLVIELLLSLANVNLPNTADQLLLFAIWGAGFGIGAAVTWETRDKLAALRDLMVLLVRVLIPIGALIAAIIVLQIMVGNGQSLIGNSDAFAGITVTFLMIILIAAGIEDPNQNSALSKVIDICVWVIVTASLISLGYALWGIAVRINAFGLTPNRIIAAIGTVIGLGYMLGYFAVIIRNRTDWRGGFARVNIVMALVVMAVAFLLGLRLPSLEKLSADSQYKLFLENPDLEYWNENYYIFTTWGPEGVDLIARTGIEGSYFREKISYHGVVTYQTDAANLSRDEFGAMLQTLPLYDARDLTLKLALPPEASKWIPYFRYRSSDHDLMHCTVPTANNNPPCAILRFEYADHIEYHLVKRDAPDTNGWLRRVPLVLENIPTRDAIVSEDYLAWSIPDRLSNEMFFDALANGHQLVAPNIQYEIQDNAISEAITSFGAVEGDENTAN